MVRAAKIMVVLGLLVLCGSAWAVEPNLVSHWKFDEGSGTTAYDSAGGNDGTIYGATWTTGQLGGALDFDGSGDYVLVLDDDSLTPSSELTISSWVYINSISWSDRTAIVNKYDYVGGDRSYFLQLGKNEDPDDNSVCLQVSSATRPFRGKVEVCGTTQLQAYQWYHVVVTHEADHEEVWINGLEEIDDTDPSIADSIANNNEPLYIGYHKDENTYFNGTIDDVRIYDRVLSAGEIRRLYLEGLSDYERAIICVENAIDKKQAALETVDAALVEEGDAYDALEELLESGDYGDLNKRDIVKAKQEIHSAMQHQERSADALEGSIEKLYDALAALGWEPEPEFNLPEP